MKNIKPYDNYKPTRIDWLGEIPKHWEVRKLKNNCKVVNGATPSTNNPEYWDGNINWITPAEINNFIYISNSVRKITKEGYKNCGTSLIPIDSVVLTTRAPIGKLVINKVELCTNQGCKSIISNNINTKFLYYQLSIRVNELNGLGTGTTFMELGGFELKNLPFICPIISEQTSISLFLDFKLAKIDRFIRKKKQIIKLLNEQKASIINHAVTKGIDPTVSMKPSGIEWLGDIPGHWELKRLKYLLKSGQEGIKIGPFGSAIKSDIIKGRESFNSNEKFYKVYGQEHPIASDFTIGNKYLNQSDYDILSNYKLSPGDIIISMMGTIGRSKVVPIDIENGIMDSHLIRIGVNENIYANYISFLINDSKALMINMLYESKGSIMNGLNSKIIKALYIPLPPKYEQLEIQIYIEKETDRINKVIETIENEIALTQEYRTALITEVVTGKIDVREYKIEEEIIEEIRDEEELEEEIDEVSLNPIGD